MIDRYLKDANEDEDDKVKSCGKLILETNDPKLQNKTIFFRCKYKTERQQLEKKLDIKLFKSGEMKSRFTCDESQPAHIPSLKVTVIAHLKNGKIVAERIISFTINGLKSKKTFFFHFYNKLNENKHKHKYVNQYCFSHFLVFAAQKKKKDERDVVLD